MYTYIIETKGKDLRLIFLHCRFGILLSATCIALSVQKMLLCMATLFFLFSPFFFFLS